MGLKPLLSFSSGEVDPILHDRVTLEKFKKGLDTARNVMIGKTGSILSRFSRAHFVKAKNDGEAIKLYSPPNSQLITEWGNLYVRVYGFDGSLLRDEVTPITEAKLEDLHFESSGSYIYAFAEGEEPVAIDTSILESVASVTGRMFNVPGRFSPVVIPTTLTVTPTGTPTGYAVDYLVTAVYVGEETLSVEIVTGVYLLPSAAGESNLIDVRLDSTYASLPAFKEIRVYRRPNAGGAYGFIGASSDLYNNAGALHGRFIDLGGLADFNNGPQSIITELGFSGVDIKDLLPSTGIIYQQRLLLANVAPDEESIIASRPGYPNNFYRDYPYDADSALKFKSGTSGKAKVLRMIDKDGLIVFTSVGIFINLGILNIDNVALEKKGSWIIDETIPPLAVPGGVFFVDKSTDAIRQFVFSNDIQTYQSLEQSIFSAHLFKQKTITSWAFQGGVTPLIIVTFSDGTFATFTYNSEHQMRAWTRHDSEYPVEQVAGTEIADATFFVTNKDGNRYIEVSLPREIPASTYASNPEADKIALNCFSDANKTKQNLLNDSLAGSDIFLLVPTVTDDWEDELTLTCGTSGLFPVGGLGDVGTVFRFFDTTDRSAVDLTVVSRTNDNEVVVQPSAQFPSAQASDFRMYETFLTVTDLDHLEGENVTVMVDGYVVNSPNNDVESYTPIVVASGEITLPELGAIIIVGRPITADIKTLNISTVEQSPTLIESLTVDKLYIRVQDTRGLYVDNQFPEEKTGGKDGTSVLKMQDLDLFFVPDGYDIIGNRYKQPVSKRLEHTIPGSWKNNGQIAIRQVDPLHFQILSIIPDVEVLKRSNR